MDPIDCSVLIIDDQESDRYYLKRLLRKANIRGHVTEASDGQQAIDYLAAFNENKLVHNTSFPPNAILLDINMPIMNGIEFLAAFSTLSEHTTDYQEIVFAILTSSVSEEDYERVGRFAFVRDYLTKDTLTVEVLSNFFRSRIATM
jgi:CheY-like chemotaxis protein